MTQKKNPQKQQTPHAEILDRSLIEQLNEAQDEHLPSAAAKKRMHGQLLAKIKAKQAENKKGQAVTSQQTQTTQPDKTSTGTKTQDKQPDQINLIDTLTIRSKEGQWIEIRPKVEIKPLHLDREAGSRSFLMRLQAGAHWPEHKHTYDEECIVLEGDVSIGDLTIHAGDYHLAPKGVTHGRLSSEHGALLFLRAGIADTEPDLGTKASYVWRSLNTRLKSLWGTKSA